ncbi:MAG: bacterio-opsin activator domain-containing protein [Halosimplex sp.]
MSIIAEFRVPAPEFLLEAPLEASEGVVTLERMVVDGDESVTPYVWVSTDDYGTFEAALREGESAGAFEVVEAHERERLYRVDWTGDRDGIVGALDDASATVLSAEGEDGVWTLRALFADREAVSTVAERLRSAHSGVDLVRIYRGDDPSTYGRYEVTEEQRDALLAAREAGYFAVPRECTLQEVADELGISRNAASARLRRGHDALVAHTLDHDEGPAREPP